MNAETTYSETDVGIHQDTIYDSAKITQIKIKINTLLWEEMPDSVTLAQLEKVSGDIFEHIMAVIEG